MDQKLRLRSGVYFFDVFRRVRGVGGVSPALLRAAHVADAHVHAQPLRVDSVRGGDEDGPVGVLRGGGEAAARVIHPALRLRHVFLRVRGLLPRDSGGHRVRDGRRGRHHEHLRVEPQLRHHRSNTAVRRGGHAEHGGVRRHHPADDAAQSLRHPHDRQRRGVLLLGGVRDRRA